MSIPEKQRRLLWARSAGRCAVCNRDLTRSTLSGVEFTLGEAAHVVGQQATPGSPRGLLADLTEDERNRAENLVLLCEQDHAEVDAPEALDVVTIDRLLTVKRRHEDHVRHVTELSPDRRTSVLRMLGRIRGDVVELDRTTAASAILAGGDRFPRFDLSFDQQGIEIDLRNLPAESDAADQYFEACRASIDAAIDKVKDGIAQGEISHLSVFGFSRIGPLVYLGSRLGDSIGIDVYQRHRASETWEWGNGESTEFVLDVPESLTGDDCAVVLNLSGTVEVGELPEALQLLPRLAVAPTITPHPDVLRTQGSRFNLTKSLRELFATVEVRGKHIRRLHIVGAIPVSAAIELGRLRDAGVHPSLCVYERDDGSYHSTMEIA